MKRIFLILAIITLVVCLFGCSADQVKGEEKSTTTSPAAKEVTEIYEHSKFTGNWYNTYSESDIADFELKADGTAIYKGEITGTWNEYGDGILIDIEIYGKPRNIKAYFVIAGDGFVAKATPENQHYLEKGEGELQLEIMLTENTCIYCVKKETKP